MKKKKLFEDFIYILFLYFISAVFGGLLESIYIWFLFGKFDIGGFMYGPWRPIYGYGCLFIYFITKKVKDENLKVFFSCFFLCSIFEYISSYGLEVIFNRTWWDYSNNFLNLNGRICLFNSVIWGALGLIFIKYIEPILYKVYNYFDRRKMTLLIMLFFIVYQVDSLFSWLNNLR